MAYDEGIKRSTGYGGSLSAPAQECIPEVSPLESAFRQLGEVLEELSNVVGILDTRLQPVMFVTPEKVGNSAPLVNSPSSYRTGQVLDAVNKTREIRARIQTMIKALET